MSTFSFPEAMKPDAMTKAIPDMSEWMKSLPATPVSPLMAHPMAASAAAMAVGFGIAGQMMGMMAGTMEGAFEASRRFGLPGSDHLFDQPSVGFGRAGEPEKAHSKPKAKAATRPGSSAVVSMPDKAKPRPAASARSAQTAGPVSDLKAAADTAANAVVESAPAAKSKNAAGTADSVVPENFKRPTEGAKPAKPHDLKRISGIGPKLEQVLNGLGIWTYGQIAGWSAEEVAWVDDYLQFKGRVARDTWQEQAKALAAAGK